MRQPEVSVVIASRNAVATLGIQLTALSKQACSFPWNVVISDNGSTDGTVALAHSYADRLPGLVVVDSSAQVGPGHARNVGASATSAPFLAFCDADDEAAAGWLPALARALQQNPFVAGRFESQRLNDDAALRSRTLQQSDRLQESPFGPGLPHAGAGNLGIRRDIFASVGGFDAAVGCLEDTDLCWRIQLTGVPLVFAPEAVMHVRLRSSLSGMWSQGRAYGEASALLENRYRDTASALRPVGTGASVGPGATVLPLERHRTGGGLVALLRQHRSPGSLLWAAGWHLGHRQWRPSGTAATVTSAGSRAAGAA
jgi:glycosyltransferase involved in cell wall biosynthesis